MVSRLILGGESYFETELPEGGKMRSWMLFALLIGVLGGVTSAVFMRLTIRVKRFYGQLYEFVIDEISSNGQDLEKVEEKTELQGHYLYSQWTRTMFAAQFRPFWGAVATCLLGLLVW